MNSSIWPINETLTGTTTLGQGWPGSNGYERVLLIPLTSRLRLQHQIQFNFIPRIRTITSCWLSLGQFAGFIYYVVDWKEYPKLAILISLIYSNIYINNYFHSMRFFHWSLSDTKSPQVPRTLLNILVYFYSTVVWIVSVLPLIFSSFSLFSKPLEIVPKDPSTIYFAVIFKFPQGGQLSCKI